MTFAACIFSRVCFGRHQREGRREPREREFRGGATGRSNRIVNTSFPIYAVTRAKNAIVGVAPRDAITGGIPGTRSLIPTSQYAADTPCLCTKTTPLSLVDENVPSSSSPPLRWKEARLKFQPDTSSTPVQKASVSVKCFDVYLSGSPFARFRRRTRINQLAELGIVCGNTRDNVIDVPVLYRDARMLVYRRSYAEAYFSEGCKC